MRGKYIVGLALDGINNRRLEAILFSTTMTHKDAGELFAFGENVVSAGFFELTVRRAETLEATSRSGECTVSIPATADVLLYGRSESLDIDPQDFDIIYVKRALGLLPEDYLTPQERLEGFEAGLIIIENRGKKK